MGKLILLSLSVVLVVGLYAASPLLTNAAKPQASPQSSADASPLQNSVAPVYMGIVGANASACVKLESPCSVNLPPGASTYMYATTEGGEFNVSAGDFTPDLQVTNQLGQQSVVVGHSSNDTGIEDTGGAEYPIIGGIAVNGTLLQSIPFQSTGVGNLTGSFSLSQDSLVVLVSASSNNNAPVSVSSPFTVTEQQTTRDCDNFTGCEGVVMAFAVMGAGEQNFSIQYTPVAAGYLSPVQQAVGVVLYIFSYNPSVVQTVTVTQTVTTTATVTQVNETSTSVSTPDD